MRTREQVIADCEAAYERLRAEVEGKRIVNPCSACDWGDSYKGAWCHHPLIKGLGEKPYVGEREEYQRSSASLCGPEKALWEPRRNLLQRLLDWIAGLLPQPSSERKAG